jgi:hypothetical protein
MNTSRLVPIGMLLLAALVAACSDEDKRSLPTPGVTTIGQASVTTAVTPFPTPRVTSNQVDSTGSKGYSATFPEGWNFYPNRIQTRDASADVIFEPLKAGANAQASISITCIVAKQEDSSIHITFEATKVARIGTNSNIVESQRQVTGTTATVLTYRFESPNEANIPPLDKQDVLFSAGNCDWIITTTAPGDQRPQYQSQFDAFLDSFQVVQPG